MHDLGGFEFKIGAPATDAVLHRYYAADTPHSHNLTDLVRSLLRSTEPDTGTPAPSPKRERDVVAEESVGDRALPEAIFAIAFVLGGPTLNRSLGCCFL